MTRTRDLKGPYSMQPAQITATASSPAEDANSPPPTAGETLIVRYAFQKKATYFSFFLLCIPIYLGFVDAIGSGFSLIGVLLDLAVLAGLWVLLDCLLTITYQFSPEAITKHSLFGKREMPTSALVLNGDAQGIRFSHGTTKNLRESVGLRRSLLAEVDCADLFRYASRVYRVSPNHAEQNKRVNSLALIKYHSTVLAYRAMAVFLVLFVVVLLFMGGIAPDFGGLTPQLPDFYIRLGCVVLTILGVWFSHPPERGDTVAAHSTTTTNLLEQAGHKARQMARLAIAAAALGFMLFMMFGNLLDFYLFMGLGVLLFYHHYPRLSHWERIVDNALAKRRATGGPSRRSLQVSLVLLSTLTVGSYGEGRYYLYNNREGCLTDWGSENCQAPPIDSRYAGENRNLGPEVRSTTARPRHAIGLARINRGGFGFLGSFHASFGG